MGESRQRAAQRGKAARSERQRSGGEGAGKLREALATVLKVVRATTPRARAAVARARKVLERAEAEPEQCLRCSVCERAAPPGAKAGGTHRAACAPGVTLECGVWEEAN